MTGDGPPVMREKTHSAKPMSLDQALYEMELVGHDFYLFVDAEDNLPSVVYRRRGYDYGVIRLAVCHCAEEPVHSADSSDVRGTRHRGAVRAPLVLRPGYDGASCRCYGAPGWSVRAVPLIGRHRRRHAVDRQVRCGQNPHS